jgi:hypothetical protein
MATAMPCRFRNHFDTSAINRPHADIADDGNQQANEKAKPRMSRI